ncbi:homoserine dehydrogenase [Melghirimyces profundicolus]|uniref:Homoserine dehydrogenase n=1 Tax=Melghirimyces profundicolus TaxID=1242148 RepID=A0A2T6BGU9_9BACL|nr:homoserine dehydrogenase [Melghirimyces profundicolus]PTX55298.1 homoserine dehydrogenase [Melghirimyces profundicolus]
MAEEPIRVGLMGLGTVGSGVVRLIEDHQNDLCHQTGQGVSIEKILVRDRQKERKVAVDPSLLTERPEEILKNDRIDLIVEVMGGIEPTRSYLREALENGKHVVTANKDLMALHGAELLSVAARKGCDVFYEASVAGGIPILRALAEGFSSDRITKMVGIVNGTTNYILTEMARKGTPFQSALARAQELGYAESDPTSDVEGMDAARKMAILATLGFHMDLSLDEVTVRGISGVTPEDLRFAAQLGYVLKLVGIAARNGEKVEVVVEPALLPQAHPLAAVDGVYNAVCVYGEAVGETMFYGPGAGAMPTATAVVSDLVTVVKNMRLGGNGRAIVAPYREKRVKGADEIFAKYFLRLRVEDEAGVLAKLTLIFAEAGVSLEKVLQEPGCSGDEAEIVLVTHTASRDRLDEVLLRMEELPAVRRIMSHYRVEGGE